VGSDAEGGACFGGAGHMSPACAAAVARTPMIHDTAW
jgi:hypothetical protein